MLLVYVTVVRDEEEILEANIAYHLAQGVDFVLVADHGSVDATPKILDSFANRASFRSAARRQTDGSTGSG